MSTASSRPAPVVVLGPTASGKSDVAMAYARDHRGGDGAEIVAVDSMQVYRSMDIGTAKPSVADQAAVVHHCLDLVDPDVDHTVAEFAVAARAALDVVAARGHRAVLVAGTGLYLRSVTDPMEIPGRWPQARRDVELRLAERGSAALHRELGELDPLAASRMEPSNERRVVRALEVVLGSGRPFSSFGAGIGDHPPSPFVQIGLQWPRARLAERIESRVHAMMDRGLLAEVEQLAGRPAGWSRTARQALGYKELLAHLDGDVGLDEAVDAIVTRTRQFAVRQERWFRRDPRIRWVPVSEDPVAEVLPILQHS
ncbi:MAG: tRNA delta(2)-isopentenylpyrophosphate transferase [Ilumatobacteraceae bacterium]|nr:tRNA delta(2)-isopentenylpyrophosphate transferase [Ilumatobacteraceae bacterium]